VRGADREARVARAADHLVLVVLAGERREGRLDHATAEPQHKVQGRLLLDVVVGEGPAVLELLAGKDEALLIGRDACAEHQQKTTRNSTQKAHRARRRKKTKPKKKK
jgi:hypothetical protein